MAGPGLSLDLSLHPTLDPPLDALVVRDPSLCAHRPAPGFTLDAAPGSTRDASPGSTLDASPGSIPGSIPGSTPGSTPWTRPLVPPLRGSFCWMMRLQVHCWGFVMENKGFAQRLRFLLQGNPRLNWIWGGEAPRSRAGGGGGRTGEDGDGGPGGGEATRSSRIGGGGQGAHRRVGRVLPQPGTGMGGGHADRGRQGGGRGVSRGRGVRMGAWPPLRRGKRLSAVDQGRGC